MKTNKINKPSKTCLTPYCHRVVNSRGLCQYCYMTARKLVEQERVTWETLEKAGKALPPKGDCIQRSKWFLKGVEK